MPITSTVVHNRFVYQVDVIVRNQIKPTLLELNCRCCCSVAAVNTDLIYVLCAHCKIKVAAYHEIKLTAHQSAHLNRNMKSTQVILLSEPTSFNTNDTWHVKEQY